eukprot:gene13049-14392_t
MNCTHIVHFLYISSCSEMISEPEKVCERKYENPGRWGVQDRRNFQIYLMDEHFCTIKKKDLGIMIPQMVSINENGMIKIADSENSRAVDMARFCFLLAREQITRWKENDSGEKMKPLRKSKFVKGFLSKMERFLKKR